MGYVEDILVSVITPCHNSAQFIKETYECLVQQTYWNWEWLVVDDASDDDTISILSHFARLDDRIRVLENAENSGAAVSRNVALRESKGEFVAFLDSDDLWYPNKLMAQLSYMTQNKKIKFSFTKYELCDESGRSLGKIVDDKGPSRVSYKDMLKKSATLGCSTVMLHRSIVNHLMPLLRTGQDYAFWLLLLRVNSVHAYKVEEVLALYRVRSGSISRNKLKKARRQWQIYRDVEGLGLFYSALCFTYYAYHAVFRR